MSTTGSIKASIRLDVNRRTLIRVTELARGMASISLQGPNLDWDLVLAGEHLEALHAELGQIIRAQHTTEQAASPQPGRNERLRDVLDRISA